MPSLFHYFNQLVFNYYVSLKKICHDKKITKYLKIIIVNYTRKLAPPPKKAEPFVNANTPAPTPQDQLAPRLNQGAE